MEVNIGLDIGIASVGWAILDQDLKIIKHGVRLFPTVDSPKDSKLNNEKRREKRSGRRQKNRRRNLKLDFIKLLKKYELINLVIDPYDRQRNYYQAFTNKYIDDHADLFTLRQKGLSEKLSARELIQVLYWYLSHRGFKYELADEKAEKEKEATLKKFGEGFNKDELPINIQIKHFTTNGYYRSELNRLFSSKDYMKEIAIILKNSSNNHDFSNDYSNLFQRQRSFEVGPGPKQGYENLPLKNYQLISRYSRYYVDEKTGVLKWHNNIWDKTIGKCTYFHDQFRAPKNSLTSEIFNLLNDLNNLSIGNHKLTREQKINCLKIAFKTKDNTNKIRDEIVRIFNVEKKDIKGFRINKKKVPLTTPLTSLYFINKKIKDFKHQEIKFEQIFDGANFDFHYIDQIVDILSQTKIIENRIENLSKIDCFQKHQELLTSIAKGPSWSDTHALSYKAMKIMIPIMLDTHKNQMQIAHELEWKSSRQLNIANQKYIPTNWIEDLIGTPSVKRALRQTINLLNAIFKQHKDYKIANIVIEMARENKNTEVREAENELQKFMENRQQSLQSLIDAIKKNYPDKKVQGQALAKLWLYEQQKGLDAYTGQELDIDQVVMTPSYTDIDHIIPYSQCFDDSRNNKVLTLQIKNSEKGQQTPYQWLKNKPEEFARLKNLWTDWYSSKNNLGDRIIFASQKKLEYITSEIDFSDPQNSLGFIQRHLVDTRYTTRELLGVLNEFKRNLSENHALKHAKIKTVNGRMTSFYRKLIEKDKKNKLLRPAGIIDGSFDEKGKKIRIWNGHHAEDAVIVTHIALRDPKLDKIVEKVLSSPNIDKLDKAYDKWLNEDKETQTQYIDNLRDDLNNHMHDVKFSYMLNKKTNIQLFNETLYGVKRKISENQAEKIYKVERPKLVDLSTDQLAKIFSDNYKYTISMKEHDPKTFAALKERYISNLTDKFTFKHLADKHGVVKVSIISKNANTPIERHIKSIKIIKEEKDQDAIIMRDNSKAFYETMYWTEMHLFKTSKGDYRIIPINATVANLQNRGTFKHKDLYFKKLQDLGLDQDAKPSYIIHRGTIIVDKENNLYRVCGLDERKSSLELKRLDGKPNLSSENKKMRDQWTLNTKLIGCQIVLVDYLGNVFRKFEFTKNINFQQKINEKSLQDNINQV